jgi:transposase InsO family protein
LRIRALISAGDFDPIKSEFGSLYSGFKGRANKGAVRHDLRSDNGGEYRGPFERYCRKFGIGLEKTPPKTPQLNGLAERMNRTLTERVTYMLSYAKLPNSFWAEALNRAMYVLNLSPSVPLTGDIPQRVWLGKEVSYKQLKVFG